MRKADKNASHTHGLVGVFPKGNGTSNEFSESEQITET